MPKGSSPAEAIAESDSSPEASTEETADMLIADYGGDSRAAVVALLKVVYGLMHENGAIRRAASPGFVRLPPAAFEET
jgi:hypothetical protein